MFLFLFVHAAMLAIILAVATADTLRMKIVVEKDSPYIKTRSDQTNGTIKFLLDTGTPYTVIAKDLLIPDAIIYGQSLEVMNANLDDGTVKTYGKVDIVFPREFGSIELLAVNVMDRSNVGGEDGLFGFDLIDKFQMEINIHEKDIVYTVEKGQRPAQRSAELNGRQLVKQLSRHSSRKLLKTYSRKLSDYYTASEYESEAE